MKTNTIRIKPDRLGFPLETCAVGRLSSAVFTIGGDIPDDIASIAVEVEYKDGDTEGRYTAAATRQEDGTHRAYLAPAYFPATSDSLKYHVLGIDERNNPRWLGTGALRILDNPADGSPVVPSVLPRNLYAYNPATRLYHKISAEANDLGEISVSIDQEGVKL